MPDGLAGHLYRSSYEGLTMREFQYLLHNFEQNQACAVVSALDFEHKVGSEKPIDADITLLYVFRPKK